MLNLGVTIYSLQADFRAHRYDLYHCLKELHKLGIKGIEIVSVPEFFRTSGRRGGPGLL